MLSVSTTTELNPFGIRLREIDDRDAPPAERFPFKQETLPGEAPPIYRTLADHQCSEEGWDHRDLLAELHRWTLIFERVFALGVPEVALAVDRLRCTRPGHFRDNHNGFGLKGEIVLNEKHQARPFWNVLGTLLHELLHGWQQAHGRPGQGNYYNKQFREKARQYGLVIDSHGHTQYEPEGLFLQVLERHGVRVPELPRVTSAERPRGTSNLKDRSNLKKWSCGCTNVRVAVSTFSARCLLCNRLFEPAEPM